MKIDQDIKQIRKAAKDPEQYDKDIKEAVRALSVLSKYGFHVYNFAIRKFIE